MSGFDLRLVAIERRARAQWFAARADVPLPDHARRHRVLTRDTSAIPGRFQPKPYQIEPMLALDDPEVRSVCCVMPSQVGGKTEIGLCWFLKTAHINPGPMLAVEPTLAMARTLSEERIDPMFAHAAGVGRLLASSGTKGKGNRQRFKRGAGWSITMIGARSAAELSMRPIRDVWLDEPDRYPAVVGEGESTEGTVIQLADGRQRTYEDRKRLITGTPVWEDLQNSIWVYHRQGSGGEWNVPCPHCGHVQPLEFGDKESSWGLKWPSGKAHLVEYLCGGCGALIPERYKGEMNRQGRYIHARADNITHRSFHFEAVASELITWPEVVALFHETGGLPDKLQVFQNTVRALPWTSGEASVDPQLLQRRRREPHQRIPNWARREAFVGSIDVQHDRLEVALVAWGPGERCWMRVLRIEGDTSSIGSTVWQDCDRVITAEYHTDDGTALRPRLVTIDIGDQQEVVAEYVRTRRHLGVRAVRGVEVATMREPVARAKKHSRYGIAYWRVQNDATKRVLFRRLAKVTQPGPGFIEFATDVTDEMLEQFGAEKLIRENGRRVWRRLSGRPNEMIDLWRYAWAALWILPATVRDGLRRLPQPAPEADGAVVDVPVESALVPEDEPPPPPRRAPRSVPRRSGWFRR